jgi:hypothetical protein
MTVDTLETCLVMHIGLHFTPRAPVKENGRGFALGPRDLSEPLIGEADSTAATVAPETPLVSRDRIDGLMRASSALATGTMTRPAS